MQHPNNEEPELENVWTKKRQNKKPCDLQKLGEKKSTSNYTTSPLPAKKVTIPSLPIPFPRK